jgi:hypothetical protein
MEEQKIENHREQNKISRNKNTYGAISNSRWKTLSEQRNK